MARIKCKCGKILSNTSCPNDIQLKVFTDYEYENILSLKFISDLPPTKYDVWRCPDCERVYVFDNNNELIKTYVLEYD